MNATSTIDTAVEPRTALAIRGVTLSFGGVRALDGVSFDVKVGETLGLVGPNGAGKTSLLNCLNGAYRPGSGEIEVFGQSIKSLRPHRIAALGMSRTFQSVSLSPGSSVVENVLVGAHTHTNQNLLKCLLGVGPARAQERRLRTDVSPILETLNLVEYAEREVGLLPLGTQRRVEIARAIAARARIIVFDEPTSGMNAEEREEMAEMIRSLQGSSGLTQVIVEHDARFIKSICSRVVVLDFGRVIADGSPDTVFDDPRVIEAYIGTGDHG